MIQLFPYNSITRTPFSLTPASRHSRYGLLVTVTNIFPRALLKTSGVNNKASITCKSNTFHMRTPHDAMLRCLYVEKAGSIALHPLLREGKFSIS